MYLSFPAFVFWAPLPSLCTAHKRKEVRVLKGYIKSETGRTGKVSQSPYFPLDRNCLKWPTTRRSRAYMLFELHNVEKETSLSVRGKTLSRASWGRGVAVPAVAWYRLHLYRSRNSVIWVSVHVSDLKFRHYSPGAQKNFAFGLPIGFAYVFDKRSADDTLRFTRCDKRNDNCPARMHVSVETGEVAQRMHCLM